MEWDDNAHSQVKVTVRERAVQEKPHAINISIGWQLSVYLLFTFIPSTLILNRNEPTNFACHDLITHGNPFRF